MDIAATFAGLRIMLRNARYCSSYVKRPHHRRTQAEVQNFYRQHYARDIQQFRRENFPQEQRLAIIDNCFRYVHFNELDVYFVREHYARIREFFPAAASAGGSPLRNASANERPRVLEVGSGDGKIIFPLSVALPSMDFHGIEYSESGPKRAAKNLEENRREIEEKARRIAGDASLTYQNNVKEFTSGDAKQMPYPDNYFDLSYTNLVLEQMPASVDHRRAIAEMKRVSKRACLFLEPWRESQNFYTMGYLQWVDYFRESTAVLRDLGFREVRFNDLSFHHNIGFRLGYVVGFV